MPLKGESKEDEGAVSEALARHLLDEVERVRIWRGEARGRVRRSVREVCARDAIVSGDVVWSIGRRGNDGKLD
jgi:hypothetical protein